MGDVQVALMRADLPINNYSGHSFSIGHSMAASAGLLDSRFLAVEKFFLLRMKSRDLTGVSTTMVILQYLIFIMFYKPVII